MHQQNAKSESKKLTERPDVGPYSCTDICFENNSYVKTSTGIEYDNDESLEIKKEIIEGEYSIDEALDINEEIIKDQQNSENKSNKSRERPGGASYTCTNTQISSEDNSGAKTLFKYDIENTLDLKDQMINDQHNAKRESKKLIKRPDVGPYSCTDVCFQNNSCIETSAEIEYDNDESLEIKEEIIEIEYSIDETLDSNEGIIEDQQNSESESNKFRERLGGASHIWTNTQISSEDNSSDKTLVKYDIDKTLELKDQIVNDPQNAKSESKISTERPYVGLYPFADICLENNSFAKTSTKIEYDIDKSLEIKEEIIEDQATCSKEVKQPKRKENLESEESTSDLRKDNISAVNEQMQTRGKRKMRKPNYELEKKYKCEKCDHSYVSKANLYRHTTFECNVEPQFSCEFCGRRFKQKTSLKVHLDRLHQIKVPQKSVIKYQCDQCPRSYSWPKSLNQHKRLEHALVKPQFICDYCGHKTNQKNNFVSHIARHLK
ncbi:zinc finger protein 761-like [Belonocnema kinseyi]|uniref:zinc finger protein 761-like n=1 Tax=Belonocnema kinseyi TaxID=2817044 RepID=UPI00143CF610|nr:zinc finger protein 761-like [Belonocnema kinseyi]